MTTSPQDARVALDAAAVARRAVAVKGRWPRRYLTIYGFASALAFATMGLGCGAGVLIACTSWVVLTVLLQRRSRQKPVTAHRGRQVLTIGIIGWMFIYVAALTVGYAWFRDEPAYWMPAALVVAAPFLTAALWWRHDR